MHYLNRTALVTALGILLAACGGEATPVPALGPVVDTTMAAGDMPSDSSMAMTTNSTTAMDAMATDTTMNMEHANDEHTFAFGEPAEESAATRIIDVATLDTFRFTPDPITVKVGEIVTLRVTNDGVVPHDVVLDDQEGQETHELEMQEMTAAGNITIMMDEANGFLLAAGESKVLTWTFTEPGTVYLGCHQPGHFAAGMVASVIVEP